MRGLHLIRHRSFACIALGFAFVLPMLLVNAAVAAEIPADLLKQTGIPGGLVVQLGCDEASSITGLRLHEGFKVLALDVDATKVDGVRQSIQAKGGLP